MKNSETAGNSSTINMVLVVLLIVASFLIGSLYTNVQYLKKGSSVADSGKVNNPGGNTVTQRPNQPPAAAPTADNVPKISKDDHIKGNPNAELALIEYSDMECPFCKSFHPTVQKILDTYGDKVMWVYRHFPLSFHANAQKEAEASECVNELGGNTAFWKFTDAIYERTTSNGTGFALDKLALLAQEIGVDRTKFQTCLDSGKWTKRVNEELIGGQSAGVNGTPGTVLLNTKTGKTQLVSGALPFESFKSAIDSMLGN